MSKCRCGNGTNAQKGHRALWVPNSVEDTVCGVLLASAELKQSMPGAQVCSTDLTREASVTPHGFSRSHKDQMAPFDDAQMHSSHPLTHYWTTGQAFMHRSQRRAGATSCETYLTLNLDVIRNELDVSRNNVVTASKQVLWECTRTIGNCPAENVSGLETQSCMAPRFYSQA